MKNKEEKLLLVQYSSFSNVRNRWLTVLNIKYAFFAFLVHEIVYIYIYIYMYARGCGIFRIQ